MIEQNGKTGERENERRNSMQRNVRVDACLRCPVYRSNSTGKAYPGARVFSLLVIRCEVDVEITESAVDGYDDESECV